MADRRQPHTPFRCTLFLRYIAYYYLDRIRAVAADTRAAAGAALEPQTPFATWTTSDGPTVR
jgi:hypothetical protein